MAGTTYSKFFWSDWASDPGLLISSFPAQALWMRLLCIASESDPVGHVLVGGRKPTAAEIHTLTRCPLDEVEPLIKELVENGVCDETRDGILVSRRMVRDAKKQRRNAAGGSNSAAVTPRNKKGIFTGRSNLHRPSAPATINQSPESTNHQPTVSGRSPVKTLDENIRKIDRLGTALGFDPTTRRNGHRFIEQMIRLEDDGIDFELDLLPAIEETRRTSGIPADLASLAYFRKPALAKKDAREIAAALAAQRIEKIKLVTADQWHEAANRFLRNGRWDVAFGPSPCEEGCRMPVELLNRAQAVWDRNGQHPAFDHHNDDWTSNSLFFPASKPFWGSSVIDIRAKATG